MLTNKDLNTWLEYSIQPQKLHTLLHPSMCGNGQIEIMAELDRSRISEVVCFGFGAEGLEYGRNNGEEHLIPAVYDAETGKKYLLSSSPGPGSNTLTVTFRPDRHVWRYEFDDLDVVVSLILPRLLPGYLMKVEVLPKAGNTSKRWHVYQEIRGYLGRLLRMTDAGYDLSGGAVWFMSSMDQHGEAIGATVDAESVNLGEDGAFSTNVMAKMAVTRHERDESASCYVARAFGPTVKETRESLSKLLSSPERLEAETEGWWNTYLTEVPHLETPDESFSKTFLWSWADYRMNQIDVPIGPAPAGLFNANNTHLKARIQMGDGDSTEVEAINLLHDSKPARDLVIFIFKNTRKHGFSFRALPMAANNNAATPLGWGTSVACFISAC